MKKCSVCSKEKEVSEYYKGYAKCKACHYEVTKKYRSSEVGKKVRKKEAINARLSGKKKERQKRYEKTEKFKNAVKRYEEKRNLTEHWKARLAAKRAVRYALKTGKLVKTPCWICGEKMTEAHHPSYSKDMRLAVSWLCSKHHNEIHNPVGV